LILPKFKATFEDLVADTDCGDFLDLDLGVLGDLTAFFSAAGAELAAVGSSAVMPDSMWSMRRCATTSSSIVRIAAISARGSPPSPPLPPMRPTTRG
jgi:hypothetical protein